MLLILHLLVLAFVVFLLIRYAVNVYKAFKAHNTKGALLGFATVIVCAVIAYFVVDFNDLCQKIAEIF